MSKGREEHIYNAKKYRNIAGARERSGAAGRPMAALPPIPLRFYDAVDAFRTRSCPIEA